MGVFTLGIGNAIMEGILNTIFIINGTIALVKAAIEIAKAIVGILSGVVAEIKSGFEYLGANIPKLILATMKFFGAGRRRNYFRCYNRVMRRNQLRARINKRKLNRLNRRH